MIIRAVLLAPVRIGRALERDRTSDNLKLGGFCFAFWKAASGGADGASYQLLCLIFCSLRIVARYHFYQPVLIERPTYSLVRD